VPIAGERPESGFRVEIARSRAPGAEAPPWLYEGAAHLPDASFPLRVALAADGAADVTLEADAGGAAPPGDLVEKVRLIVRTAYRQARADDEPPAWRIVRWRGEK
jgi:hypothetical protein